MGDDAKRPVTYPSCAKRLIAPQSFEGRKLKCPQCTTTFACAFDGVATIPFVAPPRGSFRAIDVANPHPERSAAEEIGRLFLGCIVAVVGA